MRRIVEDDASIESPLVKKKKAPHKKISKKQLIRREHTVVAVAIVMMCVVVAVGIIFRPSDQTGPKRLVTFYDRGVKHSVLTRATTVRDALSAAHITVDSRDEVDPSVGSTLSGSYVDVIIYRSRPVAIVDGGTRQTVMTVAQSPNTILAAAKLKALSSKDKTAFTSGNFVTQGTSVVLTVDRAEPKAKKKAQHKKVIFKPTAQALTVAKGAQVFVDTDGVAHRETYYDLPMNVVITACSKGDYHVRSDGAKVDPDGYALVAANYASYPRCTVVQTSLGPGKVYDTGGFAARYPYGFDLATDWTNHDGR